MKHLLPNITKFLAILFIFQLIFSFLTPVVSRVTAQTVTPSPTSPATPTPTIPSSLQQNTASPEDLPSDWIIDPVVTSIGKNAARAGIFLDWALQNYNWSYVDIEHGKKNPLVPFWITLRNIVYALMILVVIAGSLVLIITRGKSVTLRRFIPRFLGVVLLVTFSFAFVEFLYAVVDVFQGFFIRPGGIAISQNDLLFIGWNYKDFVGLRALGGENFESAFISLLLVKLTSFTYYAMVGILLIRKIILWFFIMISPFFPLLLFFYPLRNTAKIWLGEFFRWLLYAPLFAIFLAGLVSLWRIGIPLSFDFTNAGKGFIVFPTAVSILLGGPLQKVGIANSVSLADTFGLYLVALLMLWMVIIFPFILLQIFLDYLSNINVNQNALARQLVNFMTRPPSPSGGTPPPSSQPAGLARALPFLRDFIIPKVPTTTGLAREIPRSTQTQQQQQTQTFVSRPVSMMQKESVEKLTNISVPTLRDIVKFESISLQKDTNRLKEVARIREALQNIANPETTQMSVDRVRYSEIKDKLTEQSKSGNQVASSVLHAAQTVASSSVSVVQNITNITSFINKLANPAVVTSTREREKYVEVREKLVREQEKNNTLATTVLFAMQAMTATSKNTLQTIVQTLAHPENVSQKLKNTVIDLKETLKKESESGNQLAKTVLSVFERLERVEKMSSNLLNIQQPGRVKDTKEKEHFEKIKETLIKERTNNNALATTILTQIAKLSTVSTTDEKTQVVQAVKEAITRERENNNELASFISTELPGIMQIEGDTTLGKMQGDLEKAKADGNPLAAKLLAIATETSSEKQKERLASLQTEIAKEKTKGNPLATTLSDMLYPKPKLASKPEAFPTINRIQEVSLDDYEAVKKMWIENYQNLETTGNIGDNVSKKEWIEDDIKQISGTIDLLTSQDAEKVEEGMQKVSDILPFLLIGGFSQSEIVAYLKAKQAAAKDVLVDIEKQSNDEDTKVTVEHQATASPKTVSVSQSISHDIDSSEPEIPIVRTKEVPMSAPVVLPAPKLLASDTASTQMLRLANISIPSIRTVASYDEAILSRDAVRSQEVEKIQLALRDIANPSAVSDQTARLRYIEIHDALEKESVRGNAVATSLVSAGRLMGRLTAEAAFAGVLQLQVVLKQLSELALIKDVKEKELYTKLLETIRSQSQNGDSMASDILLAIEHKENQSPVAVLSLRSKLLAADATGNQLAGGLLGKASQVERKSFSDTLKEITGMYLLIDMQNRQKSLVADELNDTARVLAEVKKYSETGNDLAKAVLAVKDKNDYATVLSLVESVDKGSDQFARNLQVSLKRLSAITPLIQSSRPVIQQALTKVLSLLTNPLGVKAPQLTMLYEQLVDAKKSGSALASLVLEKADEKTKAEMRTVGQILSSIDNPESLSDAGEKASFNDLRARLEKEKAKNNELADEILTVAHVLGSKTVSSLDKSTIAVMLWENLVQAKNEGDQTARRVLEAVDGLTLRERLSGLLSDAIISLSHPEAITDVTKKEQYLTLKKTIITESAKGNTLALQLVPLLNASGERLDPAVLQTISAALEEQAEKGSSLAQELLRLLKEEEQGDVSFAILHMLRGVSDPESAPLLEEQKEYRELRSKLQKAAQADNIVAMSVLAGAERAKIQGDDLSEAKKLQELLAHDQSELSLSIHAFVDNEVEKYEDILMLRFLLHGMQHPDYVPDKTLREILEKLQKDLTVEAENGNSVAKQVEKTLGEISEPGVSVDQELRIVSELYGQLQKAKHDGNVRAEELISLIQAQHVRMQAGRLVSVMESIADPETAQVVRDHDSYKSIKQTLVLEQNKGNQFADFLLSLSQSFSTQRIKEEDMDAILALLYQRLIASEAEGNSFAMSILARLKLDAGTSKPPQIEAALLQAKEKDDPVANAVFAVIDEEHGINRVADGVVLPSVNRIQEVSLDDYEAVRSMWEESYKTHDIPQLITGERPIREEWLRDDVERIQSIIALLTSVDQEKINEGMQEVSGILPFLLIGGFSLSEIVAYLKAKLQAAKTVLSEQNEGDEGLSVQKSVVNNRKVNEEEMEQ